jgi:hypothetical protein
MVKNTFVVVLLIIITMSGCAKKTLQGNYLQTTSADQQQKLAGDAIKQIIKLWPPAKTKFEMQHAATDPFGLAMVKSLRNSGYALTEYKKASESTKSKVKGSSAAASISNKSVAQVYPLNYVLDQAGDLYRLTLSVGPQSITRPYLDRNGVFEPAGSWIRKE